MKLRLSMLVVSLLLVGMRLWLRLRLLMLVLVEKAVRISGDLGRLRRCTFGS